MGVRAEKSYKKVFFIAFLLVFVMTIGQVLLEEHHGKAFRLFSAQVKVARAV